MSEPLLKNNRLRLQNCKKLSKFFLKSKDPFNWVAFYAETALKGVEKQFQQYSAALQKWYQVLVYSPDPGFFVTLFTDISPEKEKTLQLENFFEVNLDLLCIADTQGYFIKVNREWEKVLGYDLEELMGKRFLDFVHPEDLSDTLEAVSILARNENLLNFVNRYRTKSGTYRYIEWRSHPEGPLIYAAARDITESVERERALKKSEERFKELSRRFQAIYDHLPMGILILSPELKILEANARLFRWFPDLKYSLGQRCYEVLNCHKNFKTEEEWGYACPVFQCLKDQKNHEIELKVKTNEGFKFFKITGVPISHEQGGIEAVMEFLKI